MLLTEIEAYPCGRTYEQRLAGDYNTGDRVTVGAHYQVGNRYAPDCHAGTWYVVAYEGNHEYSLSSRPTESLQDDELFNAIDLYLCATRLTGDADHA